VPLRNTTICEWPHLDDTLRSAHTVENIVTRSMIIAAPPTWRSSEVDLSISAALPRFADLTTTASTSPTVGGEWRI